MNALAAAGFEVPAAVFVLGLGTGMIYGLLAAGLVLIFRTSRVVNFAHGEIGAFGATVLGLAVLRWRFPYWVAFPLALLASAAVGAVAEAAVVRRLRAAPKLMALVATLGLAEVLRLLGGSLASDVIVSNEFPQPPWVPRVVLGPLIVDRAQVTMLVLTPPMVLALAFLLRRTRFGLSLRAASANANAARLAGVAAPRLSTAAWAIAGALSAFTAVLVFPSLGFGAELLGPTQLLRALAPAVVARMSSLPIALGAGVALGLAEEILTWNFPRSGFVELLLFTVILVGLLVQTRTGGASVEDEGSWLTVRGWPRRWAGPREAAAASRLSRVVFGAVLAGAVIFPLLAPNRTAVTLVTIASFSLIGLSLAVVTGLSGQLSLGQFALAGIGATASYHVATLTGNHLVSFAAAGIAAAVAAVLVGLPALRVRGMMLAVTSLSFALVAQAWLLQQPWMLGDGVAMTRPVFRGFSFQSSRRYYFFCLVIVLAVFWVVRNLRGSGFGRVVIALRDNERGAQALGISPTRRRLEAFAVAGVIAGLGGAALGHTSSFVTADSFAVARNTAVVAMAVIGGIATLAGPVLGAFYVIGIPAFVPLDNAGLTASAAGWLILILYLPGGIGELIRRLRDRAVSLFSESGGPSPQGEGATTAPVPVATKAPLQVSAPAGERGAMAEGSGPALETCSLTKCFGGLEAVSGVDLQLSRGETLGIIGPNGAGKTTLFDLLSGFLRPDAGTVRLGERDVTRLSPEARVRLGLGRSFQRAHLFETLTVSDTVQVALEREWPTALHRAAFAPATAEREKRGQADEVLELLGLGGCRDQPVEQLSTGTRRLVELACLVALAPSVLLLDEPTAGLAQAETEEMLALLPAVRAHLGASVVFVEHDLRVVRQVADRVVAMAAGKVIADGAPDDVIGDPRVVDVYLKGAY